VERLKDKKVRKQLILQGRKGVSRVMTLYFMENGMGVIRYAVYSSKHLGGAVVRNRIKRLFREILNRSKSRLGGFDLIMIPRAAVSRMDSSEIRSSVLRQLIDNGILLAG